MRIRRVDLRLPSKEYSNWMKGSMRYSRRIYTYNYDKYHCHNYSYCYKCIRNVCLIFLLPMFLVSSEAFLMEGVGIIRSHPCFGPIRLSSCRRSKSRRCSKDRNHSDDFVSVEDYHVNRREVVGAILTSSACLALGNAQVVNAAGEIDSKTGELFTPKTQMLSGGSDIARGTRLQQRDRADAIIQNIEIYNTRFITYLARFLIRYDESANEFWNNARLVTKDQTLDPKLFAQFAESVEIGLYDYFSGPYGSFSSVKAAKAGISSEVPQKSLSAKEANMAKEGVLNLLALLKARFIVGDDVEERRRQLAILFSFLNEKLQPVDEITNLLAEADNAGIKNIIMINRGFGYRNQEIPQVNIDSPPAIGNEFKSPILTPMMQSTGKILCIDVVDPGTGYLLAPEVSIADLSGKGRGAEACAIIDRFGCIAEIIVLKSGQAYVQPIVKIESPKGRRGSSIRPRKTAAAVANVSYEIASIIVESSGNGYNLSITPRLLISPPQGSLISRDIDFPDGWYSGTSLDLVRAQARVTEMEPRGIFYDPLTLDQNKIQRLCGSYDVLLPNNVRPVLNKNGFYRIIGLPAPNIYDGGFFGDQLPEGYRGLDQIFGGVSSTPITKGALSLSTSEYTRLGLAGAVSTILVRTVLNPLELVKTKIQLGTDVELLNDVKNKKIKAQNSKMIDKSNASIGTVECIQSLIQLRGIKALFQSADITFLASLVFGSLGFGATELFRRSFTLVFFDEANAATGELTLILLVAASLACIVTSFVATPFEVLRVKSMSRLDSVNFQKVLGDLMDSKRPGSKNDFSDATFLKQVSSLDLNIDVPVLYASFTPVVSRELPFAVSKFLAFDFFAKLICSLLPMDVQVGIGTEGLIVSALSGALAGVVGAAVSQPADIILTLTSSRSSNGGFDWKPVVKDLLEKEGGLLNFYVGFPARASFFFLVIGLQFFFYDYVKNLFGVGSDDLNLVLDVFYAVRKGLVDS